MQRFAIFFALLLPFTILVNVVQANPSAQIEDGQVYVVQTDDWLSKIAEKYYRDATAYPIIVEATNTKAAEDGSFTFITNPDQIEIGQKLWIPTSNAAQLKPIVTLRKEIEIDRLSTDRPAVFSPDDRLLAIGSREPGGVQVWNTGNWSQLWEREAAGKEVWQIAFSPNGQRLAVVYTTSAQLLESMSGDLIAQISHPDWRRGQQTSLAFSPNGQLLAIGGPDKILIVSAQTGQALYDLYYGFFSANDLTFSPNSQWLAGLFQETKGPGAFIVWDVLTREQRTLADILVSSSNVVFSPDAQWLVAGAPVSRVWQTQTWPEPVSLMSADDPGYIDGVVFSPDGRWLAGSIRGKEDQIWLWDVSTWQITSKIKQDGTIRDIAFSPDSQWVVVAFEKGKYPDNLYDQEYEGQLWRIKDSVLMARLPHPEQAWDATFSHHGQWVAINGGSRVRIWELETE